MKFPESGPQVRNDDNNLAECLSASPFHPLSEKGPLCPFLDNADLLVRLLGKGRARQVFKKFCKTKEWVGKPNVPQVMTDEALKTLLHSACNSADARCAMSTFDRNVSLFRIIYDAMIFLDRTVHEACIKKLGGFKGKANTRTSITHEMFREILGEYAAEERHHEALHLLALSLAMLNQKRAVDYIGELLRFFPDSAASMGCVNEEAESLERAVESESFAANTIDHSSYPQNDGFSCSWEHAGELLEQWRTVKSAFDEYRMASDQIAAADDLEAFSDAEPFEGLVRTLTRTREMIARSVAEVGEILGAECERPDECKCVFAQELDSFRRCRPSRVEQLIAVMSRAAEAATSLDDQRKSTLTIQSSLKSNAQMYLRKLGRADEDDLGTGELAFPCEDTRAISSMRDRVEQIKNEFVTTLGNARAELQARLDALEHKEALLRASGASQYREQIVATCRSLNVAEDMQTIDDCRSKVHSLEEALRSESTTPNSTCLLDAVSRLQLNRDDTVAVFDLCDALLDLGLHDTALLVLLTRQAVYSAEEIGVEADRAISVLIEAVCRAGDARLDFPEIWHAVCVSPWLLTIRRNDLASADLIERLAVMYAAEAVSGGKENSEIALLNLGMSDRDDLSLPHSVDAIVAAVISRTPFRVVTAVAGIRVDEKRQAIEECIAFNNGKYRHIQCGKATHFARFEAVKVFPELERFWKKISAAVEGRRLVDASKIIGLADPDEWIEQMKKAHDREIQSHPHYSAKIRTFVATFVDLVRDYVNECGQVIQHGDVLVDEQKLRQELERWAGKNTARQLVAKCFAQQTLGSTIDYGSSDPFQTLLSSREVISSCSTSVAWSLSKRSVQPTMDLETRIIEDLAQAPALDEIDALLVAHQGWMHLQILWGGDDPNRESDYAQREEAERVGLLSLRPRIVGSAERATVEAFDACCKYGRFEAAREILNECEVHVAKEERARMEATKGRLTSALNELDVLKDLAGDQRMSSEWVGSVFAQASEIEHPLKQLQRAIAKGDPFGAGLLPHLEESIRALTVVVRECSSNFDAVKFHLEGGGIDSIVSRGLPVTEQDAHARCPDLVDAWTTLRSCGVDKSGTAWVAFAKLFGKLCNLYHDETDTKFRFVPVASFDYPYSTYQTAFYKPKSEFLKRPLRFYLYRADVDNQARQRLDAELSQEQSAAWLHVIFAPSGAERLRKALQLDRRFRGVLVIDDAFLYRVCIEEKHDVPVRRGLHGVVGDLVSSSPFVTNGFCHEVNNIYVGRNEIIQRLLNHPQAMIWGGRRIGKTSVLHALESTLTRRNYQVALVYADVQGSEDPDLAIAQRIADTLGLPQVKSVSAFVRTIQAERKQGVKFAFLLDEVDEYIKKSRLAHDGEFPLASVLRQLVMEDPTKSTVLVYSGFHQLYFEAKLDKSKKRVGHPFVNIASDFPIRDLSHDEVVELVRTGFEEMLGIDLHPDVPSLVAERASRHPAFVQEFCRCLLDHVSRRRSHPQARIVISTNDVEEVYKADGRGDGGEQPFIFYVDETLGYNLSDLGRAIMLTIDSDKYCSKQEIYKELSLYADVAGIAQPREDHFNDTIDLLVMTNLLTQDPKRINYYCMTYPTFIEILGRLNKLGRTEIEKSLNGYDQTEKNTGILR